MHIGIVNAFTACTCSMDQKHEQCHIDIFLAAHTRIASTRPSLSMDPKNGGCLAADPALATVAGKLSGTMGRGGSEHLRILP